MKAFNQVVGLSTLKIRSEIVSIPRTARGSKVFSDESWHKLNQMSTEELKSRIKKGNLIIGLMYRPEMSHTKAEADKVSSNLRYQQDAIQKIIEGRREIENGRR